ncbi:hypothetical protein A0H81_05539 [Grifola frondosa]|uniref:Uncharacterized protein n=1 Tax=Grifola frondosa TaxID=5627 RepID=A0A1C7MBQ4_GRIFR|nr:hypothetical protein A0H81_05539 [Grifola frondosa]
MDSYIQIDSGPANCLAYNLAKVTADPLACRSTLDCWISLVLNHLTFFTTGDYGRHTISEIETFDTPYVPNTYNSSSHTGEVRIRCTTTMCIAIIPQEVLEQIAFFAATDGFLGPPAGITALLKPRYRRSLSDDAFLKRVRARMDSLATSYTLSPAHEEWLTSILWTAYLMMLENNGKNWRQLKEYAGFDLWLREFLFHPSGASLAPWSVNAHLWPRTMNGRRWPYGYFGTHSSPMITCQTTRFRDASSILKLFALGAHQYLLCYPSWHDFIPPYRLKDASLVTHFSTTFKMIPPCPAAPSILAYLTLANKLSVSYDRINYMTPPSATIPSLVKEPDSREWDADWARSLHLGDSSKRFGTELSGAFVPGSLEGVWEGLFTYTEFTAYAALLSGAPPTVLQRSLVAQHPHLWKIREHHLYASDDDVDVSPVAAGCSLRAYIPNGTEVHEGTHGLEVKEPGRAEPILYTSWASVRDARTEEGVPQRRVRDVFITGEGHSAWGQFNIIGRVRPCDGFISLSKDYVDGDRGRWLYRGYMVGNAEGNLSGRWRDTLSPGETLGYEGCFVMSRRK